MNRRCALAIALVLALVWPAIVVGRTWTSRDGKQIAGDFVDVDETKVTLKKADGKQVTFKLELLCDADQAFLKNILLRRKLKKNTLTVDEPSDASDSTRVAIPEDEESPGELEVGDVVESSDDEPGIEMKEDENSDDAASGSKKTKIENRTWTDRFGNTMAGKFVRIQGNMLILLRSGRHVNTDYWQLCDEDQLYVRNLLEEKRLAYLIPRNDPSSTAGNGLSGTVPRMATSPSYPGGASTRPRPAQPPADDGSDFLDKIRGIDREADRPPAPSSPPAASYSPPTYSSPSYSPPPSMPSAPSYRPPPTPSYSYAPPPSYSPPPPTYSPPTYSPPSYSPPPYTPPSYSYSPPVYTPPSYTTRYVKQCMSCNREVSSNLTAGDSCPHCGVFFGQDITTGRTAYSGMSLQSSAGLGLFAIVFSIVAMLAWWTSRN